MAAKTHRKAATRKATTAALKAHMVMSAVAMAILAAMAMWAAG